MRICFLIRLIIVDFSRTAVFSKSSNMFKLGDRFTELTSCILSLYCLFLKEIKKEVLDESDFKAMYHMYVLLI